MPTAHSRFRKLEFFLRFRLKFTSSAIFLCISLRVFCVQKFALSRSSSQEPCGQLLGTQLRWVAHYFDPTAFVEPLIFLWYRRRFYSGLAHRRTLALQLLGRGGLSASPPPPAAGIPFGGRRRRGGRAARPLRSQTPPPRGCGRPVALWAVIREVLC